MRFLVKLIGIGRVADHLSGALIGKLWGGLCLFAVVESWVILIATATIRPEFLPLSLVHSAFVTSTILPIGLHFLHCKRCAEAFEEAEPASPSPGDFPFIG